MEAASPHRDSGLREWRRGPVAVVELARPQRANAYDAAMLASFAAVLGRLEAVSDVRVIVVTGSGERAFCAGADLREIGARCGEDALALGSAALFRRLEGYPKVCIAAINGAAVAGGMELALACDLRIAAEGARFALPEPGIGLIPAAGGTRRLIEIVGVGRAKEVILGGLEWTAETALRHGLVSRVVPRAALLDRALAWGEAIATKDALALTLAKRVMGRAAQPADELAILAEALLYEKRSNR
jgi:enoyl-CoA hydratase